LGRPANQQRWLIGEGFVWAAFLHVGVLRAAPAKLSGGLVMPLSAVQQMPHAAALACPDNPAVWAPGAAAGVACRCFEAT